MSVIRALFPAIVLAAATPCASAAAPQAQGSYVNETTGGPLRPGVYGSIRIRHAPPPPLFSPRPVVAARQLGPVRGEPLYLYVPTGHVRKWSRYCERYQACERPVFFVRVDNHPGKLGRWKDRARLPDHQANRVQPGAVPF
jgi:hypothetical protein